MEDRDSILDGGGFGFLDRFPGRQFPWLGQIAERIPRLAEFQETLGQFFEDLRERLPVNLDLPIFDWFDDWQPGQAAGASQTAGIKKTLPTRIVPMAVELDETDEDTATPTDFVAGARERPSLASAMSRIDQRLQLMVQDMAVFGARDGMEGLTRRRESLMVEDWYA